MLLKNFAYACTCTSPYFLRLSFPLTRTALNRRITKCETFGIASRSRAFNEEITSVYKLTDPRERGTYASSRSKRSVDDSLWKRKLSAKHRLAATHDAFVSRQYWRSYNDTIVGAVDRAQPSKWLCKLTRVLSNEITFGRKREWKAMGKRERERGGTSKKRIESKRHKRIKGVPRKLGSINKWRFLFSPLFSFFSPIRHAIFMLVQNKILITNGRSSVAIHETGSRTFRFVRVSISHFLLA